VVGLGQWDRLVPRAKGPDLVSHLEDKGERQHEEDCLLLLGSVAGHAGASVVLKKSETSAILITA
jgi:hypothetical protein